MGLISVSRAKRRLFSCTIHNSSGTSRAIFIFAARVRESGVGGRRATSMTMTRAVEEQSGNAARHAGEKPAPTFIPMELS